MEDKRLVQAGLWADQVNCTNVPKLFWNSAGEKGRIMVESITRTCGAKGR